MRKFKVIGVMRDKMNRELRKPGEVTAVPEEWIERLKKAGVLGEEIIESATVKPPENAMMPKAEAKGLGDFVRKVTEKPKPLGGGWYQLPDGRKVRKKDLEEGD